MSSLRNSKRRASHVLNLCEEIRELYDIRESGDPDWTEWHQLLLDKNISIVLSIAPNCNHRGVQEIIRQEIQKKTGGCISYEASTKSKFNRAR